MAVQTRVGMPMDEFIRAFDEAPFELIDGIKVTVAPQVAGHAIVLKQIFVPLLHYEQAMLDVAFSRAPFVFSDSDDWVSGSRVPDIMAFRTERIAAYREQTPDYADKPIILVPDLCVEIISANDNYQEVEAKVDRYLADGAKLVWVVNPRNKTIAVYTQGSDQISRLSMDATLTGGDILPGFSLPLKDVFAE